MKKRHTWVLGAALAPLVLIWALLVFPQPLFAYHVSSGRLNLYSDQPFDSDKARLILRDVEVRLSTSPIDDHRRHAVFIANAEWRRALFFTINGGAAGVNWHPVTTNVFLRRASVEQNAVFGASGKPAPPPRTLAYYAAHEITHTLTSERLGPGRLWNSALPQWVREGYADYVGMGGHIDVDDLYRRYRAGEPDLDYRRSGTYARFRLLVAYFLERGGWTIDDLLASTLSQEKAEALMNAGMGARLGPPHPNP